MNEHDMKYLLNWAVVFGFAMGGIPVFPVALDPRFSSPLLRMPFGPCIVAVLMYAMVRYMALHAGKDLGMGKAAAAGAGAALVYIASMTLLVGISIGRVFLPWAATILLFYGLPVFVAGILTGAGYGYYLNGVATQKFKVKPAKILLPFSLVLAAVCYVFVPIVLWINSFKHFLKI